MAGWHHWLDGHESQWTLGVGDGQGGLACCNSWGRRESDTTERLIWTKIFTSLHRCTGTLLSYIKCPHMCVVPRLSLLVPTQTWWGFPGGSVVKNPPANAGDSEDGDLIPGSGRSPERGNGNPLYYSCLENSMDGAAWQIAVRGVAKSWTQLNDWAHLLAHRYHSLKIIDRNVLLNQILFKQKRKKISFSLPQCHVIAYCTEIEKKIVFIHPWEE